MHHLNCVILPDNVNVEEYSASLVNVIASYVFFKEVKREGHEGIVCTAGTSATGRAMLGVCSAYNVPLISIVRNEKGKKQLEELNAKNVLDQNDPDFEKKLKELSEKLNMPFLME